MLEELFRFPVVVIDGDNEERKEKRKLDMNLPSDNDEEFDLIFGEAEYPYWDFIGIEDRWLPSTASFEKAMDGKFEACVVRFANVGQLLVPWSRKKFKSELLKFAAEYEASHPRPERGEVKIINLTEEQAIKIMKDGKSE